MLKLGRHQPQKIQSSHLKEKKIGKILQKLSREWAQALGAMISGIIWLVTIGRWYSWQPLTSSLKKTKRGSVLGLTHFMKRQVKLCTLLNKPFGWNAQDLQLGK